MTPNKMGDFFEGDQSDRQVSKACNQDDIIFICGPEVHLWLKSAGSVCLVPHSFTLKI